MSYTGPCEWILSLGAFCDPLMDWKHPSRMHKLCRGQGIFRNPPPSGQGRIYYRCMCKCHGLQNREGLSKVLLRVTEEAIRAQSSSSLGLGSSNSIPRRNARTPHGRESRSQLPRKFVDTSGLPTLADWKAKQSKRRKRK